MTEQFKKWVYEKIGGDYYSPVGDSKMILGIESLIKCIWVINREDEHFIINMYYDYFEVAKDAECSELIFHEFNESESFFIHDHENEKEALIKTLEYVMENE